MLWWRQNCDVINALIICIRCFINSGVPIGGIRVLLAHTTILSVSIRGVVWTGPVIDRIGPNTGVAGTIVTIEGTNFGSSGTVSFSGINASVILNWAANRITVLAPAGVQTGLVTVTVAAQESNGVNYYVDSNAVTITSIVPGAGLPGSTITINGTNFGFDPGAQLRSTAANFISFGTARVPNADVVSWSDTAITLRVPSISLGIAAVQVRATNRESNFYPFNVTNLTVPVITAIAPSTGFNNSTTNIIITGSNFSGVTSVKIGTVDVLSFTVASATTINAVIQSGISAGNYYISATNPSGTSSNGPASQFTVQVAGEIVIDNFETFGSLDPRGLMNGYFYSGAVPSEVSIADPANDTVNFAEGLRSMKINYPGSSYDY